MRLALLALALSAASPAVAAEIAGPTAISCRTREVFERMLRVDAAGDREATLRIMEQALNNGFCRTVQPGQGVRIEERADRFVCAAKLGSTAACEWMFAKDVRP